MQIPRMQGLGTFSSVDQFRALMPSLGSDVARSTVPYVLQTINDTGAKQKFGGRKRSHVIMDWIAMEIDKAAAEVLVRTRKNPHVEIGQRGVDHTGYYSVQFKWKTGILGKKTEYARVAVGEWPELVLVVDKESTRPVVTVLTAADLAPALALVLAGKQDKSR